MCVQLKPQSLPSPHHKSSLFVFVTVPCLFQASKQAAAAAKQAAIDKYQQARADHSPQSSSSGNTPGGMLELMPELSPMGGMNGMMSGTDSPYGTDSSMISPAAMPDHSLGCYDGVPPYVPPQESTPCSAGYRLPADVEPPGEAHIEMLRGDPSLAVQFEEVFGPGAAQYFLSGGSVQQASSVMSPSMSLMAPEPAQEYHVGRQSLDYSHDQDSDDDIIATTSSSVAKPSKGPSAPAVVDNYGLPEFPPMGAPMGDGPSPEDSESPRTVRWRQVNQQRVAMGLSPKPHPGVALCSSVAFCTYLPLSLFLFASCSVPCLPLSLPYLLLYGFPSPLLCGFVSCSLGCVCNADFMSLPGAKM